MKQILLLLLLMCLMVSSCQIDEMPIINEDGYNEIAFTLLKKVDYLENYFYNNLMVDSYQEYQEFLNTNEDLQMEEITESYFDSKRLLVIAFAHNSFEGYSNEINLKKVLIKENEVKTNFDVFSILPGEAADEAIGFKTFVIELSVDDVLNINSLRIFAYNTNAKKPGSIHYPKEGKVYNLLLMPLK